MEPKLEIGTVNQLYKKKSIDDETYNYFVRHQLPSDDDKNIWKTTPLENYNNLYITIFKESINNKKYIEDCPDNCVPIISYMVILKEYGKPFRFIDMTHSYVSKLNTIIKSCNSYKKQYKKKLLPLHIIKPSIGYWKKFFKNMYGLVTLDDFKNFIDENNLKDYKNEISWDNLLETLE